jgi:hypothetical protein
MSVSISIASSATAGTHTVTINNSGTPTRNELWRRTALEYSGAYIRIRSDLGTDAVFVDYDVASDGTYDYFVREVTGSATLDSAVQSASLHLGKVMLHATTKLSASSNSVSTLTPAALWSEPTHDSDFTYASERRENAGNTKPSVNLGVIRDGVWRLPTTIIADADRLNLVALFDSGKTLTLRTPNGAKLFGRLDGLIESYGITTAIPLQFQEASYSESL